MVLVLDLVCIMLIWIFGARGYKKGFVKGFFGVLSFAFSAIITMVIYNPVSEYILSFDAVSDKISEISKKVAAMIFQGQQENISTLPVWFKDMAISASETANTALENAISMIITSVFCIVVIYLLVKIALRLFEGVFELLMKLPILNIVNKSGGMVCGIISSVVILWIVLACIVLLAGTPLFATLNEAVQNTSLLKYFYNNNLLIKLIIK